MGKSKAEQYAEVSKDLLMITNVERAAHDLVNELQLLRLYLEEKRENIQPTKLSTPL